MRGQKDYFYTCKKCGASLDPGERCECERAEKPEKIRYINKPRIEKGDKAI